uniref:Putative glycosyltransferase n=1 Tax=Streptomyces lividus TaxID=282216 RepID=Q2MF63_STRLV|nr:putative glycosyltransferase [Streptomyces lividus]
MSGPVEPGPPPAAPRALFEIYDEGFACDTWGGVETALWSLAEGLRAHGVQADFYLSSQGADLEALADRVAREGTDAVFPLVESALFRGDRWRRLPALHRRVARIWHDVSHLTSDLTTPPPCPAHTPGAAPDPEAGCPAAPAHPDGPMREIFLRDLPWTRCFPDRAYIPWAADHLSAEDLRDPRGPVVIQLGKTPVEDAERCLTRLLAARLPVRVVFATWSRQGRAARALVHERAASGAAVEVFDTYDIRTDWKRVYGGARLFVLPSVFHETFNFAAAEAVQLGLPVATLGDCGALPGFASLTAATVGDLMDRVVTEGATVRPRPRSRTGWDEVARRYARLITTTGARARHEEATCRT